MVGSMQLMPPGILNQSGVDNYVALGNYTEVMILLIRNVKKGWISRGDSIEKVVRYILIEIIQ